MQINADEWLRPENILLKTNLQVEQLCIEYSKSTEVYVTVKNRLPRQFVSYPNLIETLTNWRK